MQVLDSLPDRALSPDELEELRESDAVVEAAPMALADDEVSTFALQVGETLYGVGYDPESGWGVVDSRVAEDPSDLEAVRDSLRAWGRETYDDRDHRTV